MTDMTQVMRGYVNGRYGDDDYPGVEGARAEFAEALAAHDAEVLARVKPDREATAGEVAAHVPDEGLNYCSCEAWECWGEDWDVRVRSWAEHVTDAVLALLPGPTVQEVREAALNAAAFEAECIIADGDAAEAAAPVPGERGRGAVVDRRDALYEDPAAWLRRIARGGAS